MFVLWLRAGRTKARLLVPGISLNTHTLHIKLTTASGQGETLVDNVIYLLTNLIHKDNVPLFFELIFPRFWFLFLNPVLWSGTVILINCTFTSLSLSLLFYVASDRVTAANDPPLERSPHDWGEDCCCPSSWGSMKENSHSCCRWAERPRHAHDSGTWVGWAWNRREMKRGRDFGNVFVVGRKIFEQSFECNAIINVSHYYTWSGREKMMDWTGFPDHPQQREGIRTFSGLKNSGSLCLIDYRPAGTWIIFFHFSCACPSVPLAGQPQRMCNFIQDSCIQWGLFGTLGRLVAQRLDWMHFFRLDFGER